MRPGALPRRAAHLGRHLDQAGDVWEGPPATGPTPSLPLALELGRIEVLGDRYVIVDPGITLDRFGWEEDAAEGMTLRKPDGTVIPLGDANAEEDEP